MKQIFLLFILSQIVLNAAAQNKYRYHIDLNKVENDQLEVELLAPSIQKTEVDFHFPKIIPGTYRVSDYGKLVKDLKAYDKQNRLLPLKKTSTNSWRISKANTLHRLVYRVDDTFDNSSEKDIYTMAGTNFEEGKNFVINPFGIYGYFSGYRDLPFELSFTKPSKFYASTSLKPESSNEKKDVFVVDDLDQLYDHPIMYNIPDTTTLRIGQADVLVSVYAPRRRVQSAFLAQHLRQLLEATAKYLGGRLPVDRYAFLFYFNGEQAPLASTGALEHNTSSFYSLPELPQQQLLGMLMDIAAHEFFHIVTPLNVSSREVKQFNYDVPVLSRHLWLYEGSTEYASDHVQVRYGLNSVQQFLDKLSAKLVLSKDKYNDTLAFTKLSQEAAGAHRQQYGNVYEKGALIAAILDIYIIHLTRGSYDLQKLKHDLSVRYGRQNYFKDEELFDVIAQSTHPEIRNFFRRYVEGNEAIPYEKFFSMAGVTYMPEKTYEDFSMGNFVPAPNPQGKVVIADISKLNDFGKRMGYQQHDEIISINGSRVTPTNLAEVIMQTKAVMKEGQDLVMMIARKNAAGGTDTLKLAAPAVKTVVNKQHVLELMKQPSEEQVLVRNAWLSLPNKPLTPQADANDVKDIPAITKTLYEVISGGPGKRNWERFRSLFYPGTQMSASHRTTNGQQVYSSFSTEDYIRNNGAFFEQNGFYEEEIGRKVEQFGNVAVVTSAYQYRLVKDGPVEQRGVNFVSLVRDKGRWYITHVIWQEETSDNPIPGGLLK